MLKSFECLNFQTRCKQVIDRIYILFDTARSLVALGTPFVLHQLIEYLYIQTLLMQNNKLVPCHILSDQRCMSSEHLHKTLSRVVQRLFSAHVRYSVRKTQVHTHSLFRCVAIICKYIYQLVLACKTRECPMKYI